MGLISLRWQFDSAARSIESNPQGVEIRTVVVTLHDPSKQAAAGLKKHGLDASKSSANPGALVVLVDTEAEAEAFRAFAADHPDTLTLTFDMDPELGAAA